MASMYNMPLAKAKQKAASLRFKQSFERIIKGIPEPDFFFADSAWTGGKKMWQIKTSEANIDKIESTIEKFDKDFTYYQIIFNGTPNIFLKIMNDNDYKFDTQNNIWIMK